VGVPKRLMQAVRAVAGSLVWAMVLAWPGSGWVTAQPAMPRTAQQNPSPVPPPAQPNPSPIPSPSAPQAPPAQPQPSQPQPAPATPPATPPPVTTPAPAAPSPFQPIPGAPPQTLPPQKVLDVVVRGNEHVPTATILQVVSTKPGDPLNEDRLRNDVQAILGLGLFADAVLRLEPAANGVTVVFIVAENPVVSDVRIMGNTVISTDDVRKTMNVPTGQVLNTVAMRQGAQAVERLYQSKGYALARVSDISVNEQGVLSVTITEGRIEAIKIVGLHKTKDYVVRRELTFKPGDVFNVDAVNASLKKLFASRYFSDVKADPGPGTQPDTVDVTITVTEQRTATLSFGAGYSTVTGLAGLVGVQDIDFGGNGQTVGASYDSTVLNGNNFTLTFHEPYFEGTRTVMDFQAFNQTTIPTDYSLGLFNSFQYTMYQTGGQVTFTTPIHTAPNRYFTYGIKSVNTQFGPSLLTSSTVPSGFVFTPGTVNAVLLGALQDTRDDPINPTRGQEIQLSTESAIAGDFNFEKYEMDFVQYWPTGNATIVGHVHLGAGSGPLPIQEQFYLGGQSSLRGYAAGRFRGDDMAIVTGEYRFPLNTLPFLKGIGGITGIVFADAGDTEPYGTLPTNLKVDYGFGIAAKTPIGLFRVDYGVSPEGGQLWISTGTTF